MKRIAFLGYSEPDGKVFYNGVVRVIYNMGIWLQQHEYQIFYYHLFSKSEYDGLNTFLEQNQIDIAIWHGTTLKIQRRLHLPCPLIFLWHSTPHFCPSVDDFCQKYHLSRFYQRVLTSKIGKILFQQVHNCYNALMFCYLTWQAEYLVLLSESFMKDFLPARIFPKKVVAIPNFLLYDSISPFNSDDKTKEVIFIGRLDNSVKRIDLLLEVWQQIEQTYHVDDWELLICGEGKDAEMLKQLAVDMNLQHVRFKGFVEPAEYYERASIMCMTSRYEGLSMVLLEAMSHGCIPLVFDSVSSASDIIKDGCNGFIIADGNITQYANTLHKIIINPQKRSQMSLATQQSISKYDKDTIMNRWEQLINSCFQ